MSGFSKHSFIKMHHERQLTKNLHNFIDFWKKSCLKSINYEIRLMTSVSLYPKTATINS